MIKKTQRRKDLSAKIKHCTRCGTPQWEWDPALEEGYPLHGKLYCCAGCAHDTGCTCDASDAEWEF